jgi:hypothetical protein
MSVAVDIDHVSCVMAPCRIGCIADTLVIYVLLIVIVEIHRSLGTAVCMVAYYKYGMVALCSHFALKMETVRICEILPIQSTSSWGSHPH